MPGHVGGQGAQGHTCDNPPLGLRSQGDGRVVGLHLDREVGWGEHGVQASPRLFTSEFDTGQMSRPEITFQGVQCRAVCLNLKA